MVAFTVVADIKADNTRLKAPEHAFCAAAELDDEGQRQALCEARLNQHGSQDEAEDIQPHHRVSQLCKGFFLRGHVEQHHAKNKDKGCEVIGNCLRHPKYKAGHKNAQHRVISAYESVQAKGGKALLRGSGQHALVQIVYESDMAEPANPDKGYDCKRRSKTRHPNLEFGFLHLG